MIGYVAIAGFFALTFAHGIVGRRYLEEYVAVYGRLPGREWLTDQDENATVEHWRRRRLAVVIPELVLFLRGLVLILTAPIG
jgi:hypothetical protein